MTGGWVGHGEEWSRAGWRAHLPGVSDPGAFAAGLGAQTIPELAAASARRSGGRLAVAVGGHGVSHAALDADAARVAGRRAGPGGPRGGGWLARWPDRPRRPGVAGGGNQPRLPALLPGGAARRSRRRPGQP